MPTENPRVQVTLDPETQGLLSALATQQHTSISATAAALIREALEQHEDMVLSQLGDARMRENDAPASHQDIWSDEA